MDPPSNIETFLNKKIAAIVDRLSKNTSLGQTQFEAITLRGRVLRFSVNELLRAVFNMRFLLFLSAAAFVFFWADTHGLSSQMNALSRFIYWQNSAIVTLLVYLFVMIGWGILSQKFGLPRPYFPTVSIIIVWPVLAINRALLMLVAGIPFPEFNDFFQYGLQNLIGFLVFELIYTEFVQPVVEAKYLRHRIYRRPKQEAAITLSKRNFQVENLAYIKSTDHYLEIVFNDGSKSTVYGKLTEVLHQSEESWGISPHRSYWIAKNAISGIQYQGRKMYLVMRNGDKIPTSEAKKKQVKDWISTHLSIPT